MPPIKPPGGIRFTAGQGRGYAGSSGAGGWHVGGHGDPAAVAGADRHGPDHPGRLGPVGRPAGPAWAPVDPRGPPASGPDRPGGGPGSLRLVGHRPREPRRGGDRKGHPGRLQLHVRLHWRCARALRAQGRRCLALDHRLPDPAPDHRLLGPGRPALAMGYPVEDRCRPVLGPAPHPGRQRGGRTEQRGQHLPRRGRGPPRGSRLFRANEPVRTLRRHDPGDGDDLGCHPGPLRPDPGQDGA